MGTTSRPPPARHSQSHVQRPKATTPAAKNTRPSATVGLTTPKMMSLRSPAAQENVRTPSPNYFGLSVDPTSDPRDSGVGPKDNWSPPTSSIRSFNAQTPKQISVEANPDFEAFRRKTEANGNFNLSHGNLSYFASTPGSFSHTKADQKVGRSASKDRKHSPKTSPSDLPPLPMDLDENSEQDSAYFSSDSKHPSEASLNAPSFFDLPRQESPASINSTHPTPLQRNMQVQLDERHPRLSLPSNRLDSPAQYTPLATPKRADTLPLSLEEGPSMIEAVTLKKILGKLAISSYLLLDLRVAPQYAQRRIQNALNLCIPTTLLKRPSFNLEKLKDTFKVESEKEQFSKWKDCKYIIVYDAHSSEKKDATSAMNTLKKFTNEGWDGKACILTGGIAKFAEEYPEMIDNRTSHEMQASRIQLNRDPSIPEHAAGGCEVAVAGGCEMPATKSAANPFFSNIRQNMDLVGGVGQIDLKRPDDLDQQMETHLPGWLRKAAEVDDHGKIVADMFLHIEQEEQMRMQKALSSRVSYGTPMTDGDKNVQIAGFEKGGKNRYNNIWPYEHARVHLQGRPEGACDYVNASHVKALRSNKRYIASQGPLPATFEDFWSVVWDQDVRVIVMLTAESEGGQLKCHPYWKNREYGSFTLKGLSEVKVSLDPQQHHRSSTRKESGRPRASTSLESMSPQKNLTEHPHVVVRKFTLSHATEPFAPMREITQLHYSSWPDFGAPAQPSHLLSLVELSNSLQRAALPPQVITHTKSEDPEASEHSRPLLVHCSAGCGRTGTFCTVDSVIDMLKRQRKELRTGVIPMDVEPNDTGDYMVKGKVSKQRDEDWIFNPDIDLIEKTVEEFRRQRISMVQSLRQYVLCYETVLEWICHHQVGRRERSGSEPRTEERKRS